MSEAAAAGATTDAGTTATEANTDTTATAAQATQTSDATTTQTEAPKTYDEAYVKKLHDSEAAARVKARDAEAAAQAKIAAALEALGIKTDAEDPAEAAKQAAAERDKATQSARDAALHLAVYKAASKVGADADTLLDSNSFQSSISEVDPTDAEAVKTAIEKAVKTNPRFKLVQAAGASGSDFSGGSGEGALTQEKFNSMTPSEKNTLFKTNPAEYRKFSGR
jgi:hypothetical protein